jgi:hypothetical protein
MWIHADPMANEDRFYLTLGQVYRMHVEAESWINRAGLRTGLLTKSCQPTPAMGKCPALALRR